MSLVERFGLDEESKRRERQEFLGLTAADGENLRRLRRVFREHAREFGEAFYATLLRHPHTAAFFHDPARLEQLKTIQGEYFARLLEGDFDREYFEGRLRVGLTHQRVGLEPVWYLGMYNQYVQLTFPLFVREFGEHVKDVLPLLMSLVKVVFLDIGLALETYFRAATERIEQRNAELQQALALYWESQRREEQLRKLASHEVRGGLAGAITNLEDLLERVRGRLTEAETAQLEAVSRRCWALSDLLGEMLAPADRKPGRGWVDLRPVFSALVERFGLYAEGRRIELALPTDAPKVWADPLQLREVFANLVANAVQYMDKEPGRVEVRWHEDGPFCVFGVADNGPGVPAELQARLFEPFARGESARKRREGTGLGLYFVRNVVEQHGGKVWVESAPGQGATFWFTVHRQPAAGHAPART